jgi:hypothetical protein
MADQFRIRPLAAEKSQPAGPARNATMPGSKRAGNQKTRIPPNSRGKSNMRGGGPKRGR